MEKKRGRCHGMARRAAAVLNCQKSVTVVAPRKTVPGTQCRNASDGKWEIVFETYMKEREKDRAQGEGGSREKERKVRGFLCLK